MKNTSNKTSAALVSVCIPVYNGEPYLRETLSCILSQTYQNFEIIIVDDCSTDNSHQVIEKFAQSDDRVKYFRNGNNLGLVANWNECIKKSSGSWIKFCFQDDIMLPQCIEKMLGQALSLKTPYRIIFCREEFIFADDIRATIRERYTRRLFYWDLYPGSQEINQNMMLHLVLRYPGANFLGEPTSFLIEKDVFEKFGYFDPTFCHMCDLEYWIRVGLNASIFYLDELLVKFRVHNQSTSMTNMSSNCFNSQYIDRLMLHRKFAYHSDYANLRNQFRTWPWSKLLLNLYAISCRRSRRATEFICNEFIKDDWVILCNKFPEINLLSKKYYLELALKYLLLKICVMKKYLQIKG